jgi:hypothetical protein
MHWVFSDFKTALANIREYMQYAQEKIFIYKGVYGFGHFKKNEYYLLTLKDIKSNNGCIVYSEDIPEGFEFTDIDKAHNVSLLKNKRVVRLRGGCFVLKDAL